MGFDYISMLHVSVFLWIAWRSEILSSLWDWKLRETDLHFRVSHSVGCYDMVWLFTSLIWNFECMVKVAKTKSVVNFLVALVLLCWVITIYDSDFHFLATSHMGLESCVLWHCALSNMSSIFRTMKKLWNNHRFNKKMR